MYLYFFMYYTYFPTLPTASWMPMAKHAIKLFIHSVSLQRFRFPKIPWVCGGYHLELTEKNPGSPLLTVKDKFKIKLRKNNADNALPSRQISLTQTLPMTDARCSDVFSASRLQRSGKFRGWKRVGDWSVLWFYAVTWPHFLLAVVYFQFDQTARSLSLTDHVATQVCVPLFQPQKSFAPSIVVSVPALCRW